MSVLKRLATAMNASLSTVRNERLDPLEIVRLRGLAIANMEDACLWRWFSLLLQDSRIRWCVAHGSWLVSVDHRHVATEATFDEAMRAAKAKVEKPGKRR